MKCIVALSLVLVLSVSAFAEVSSFHAYGSSTIIQYQGNTEVQRQEMSKGFPGTETSAPVEVTGNLAGTDANGLPSWQGYNRVIANDPQFNSSIPRDFVVNSAIGSADGDVKLHASAIASQTRAIRVLASEFPTYAPLSPVKLASAFTLDGTLAAIVPDTAGSAEGLEVSLNLSIMQDQTSLWNGSVNITGKADGTVETSTEGDFHDNDFLVVPIDVDGLAKVWAVVFNDSKLAYTYNSFIGGAFDLTAQMDFEYSVPGGLGAGAAFGTVPADMVLMTQDLFGQDAEAGTPVAAPEPVTLLLMIFGVKLFNTKRRMDY